MRRIDPEQLAHVQKLHRIDVFLESADATHECRHGRLAGDRTAPCGCFATEPLPVPDLMTVLANAEKEIKMDTETPVARLSSERVLAYATENGVVRARGAAAALGCSVEQAGYHLRRLALAGKLVAEGKSSGRQYVAPTLVASPVPPDDDPIAHVVGIFDSQLAELDARRARLIAAREAVLAVAA